MRSVLYLYLSLFFIFLIISLGLGYATLNRFDPVLFQGLSDAVAYADIVRNGPGSSLTEDRLGLSTRLLVPSLAHLIYIILPSIGTWNTVSLSMLLVNSIFTALSVVLIFDITYRFFHDSNIALIAGFLFVTNFFITNFYLVGMVEAGYGFFFLILYYALVTDKWLLLPFIMVFGCLTKEVFLVLASAFVLFTLIQQSVSYRHVPLSKVALFILMMVSGAVTIVALNYLVYGSLLLPTAELSSSGRNMKLPNFNFGSFLMRLGEELIRFSFTLGLLLFIGLFSVRKLPLWFLVGNLGVIFIVLSLMAFMFLGGNTTLSGADFARFIYAPGALLFCSGSAMTINNLTTKLNK